MGPRHVHFGPGGLGLGLIVPSTRRSFEVAAFGRVNANKQARNDLLKTNRGYDLRDSSGAITDRIDNIDFVFYDPDAPVDAAHPAVAAIAAPETQLITIAVKGGPHKEARKRLHQIAPILVLGIELHRDTDAPIVIVCENPLESRDVLRDAALALGHGPSGVVFLDSLVDRMCREPDIDAASRRVFIKVEAFSEWIIEANSSAANAILPDVIRLNPPDFQVARRRKLWLFNGADVILALRAREIGETLVKDGCDSIGASRASGFHALTAIAVERLAAELGSTEFDYESSVNYGESICDRILKWDSRAARVLKEWVVDPEPHDWLGKVNERLCTPIELAADSLAMNLTGRTIDGKVAVELAGVLARVLLEFPNLLATADRGAAGSPAPP